MNLSTGTAQPYTEQGYMKLGRNLARTFLDYYKLSGHITDKPCPNLLLLPKAASNPSFVNREREKDKEKLVENHSEAWLFDDHFSTHGFQ
ncbi:cytosolic carboxypeptidase 6-like [Octopus bimaculoides]|uniref:cytosolic carboxypeptidase 6-like n=1 Tax=Octopus bimaculoides TaxID=37653 RepID=UPI0022DFDBE4|nr:cytosolic carboxypeptidase 6-like [Octopus bimaculoides]